MGERTSEDVVKMALRDVAQRRELAAEARAAGERPWGYAFGGLLAALLLGLLAWPGAPLSWKMYAVVHGVCAQVHNVDLGGVQLPLCARNTGIYGSFLTTTLYLLALGRARAAKLPPWPITILLALLVVVMAVDGFNSMLRDMFLPHLYTPRNELRTLTGMGMGIGLAAVMLVILNISLRRDAETDARVIRGWRELGGAVAINLLVLVAIYGNIGALYWPIAIIAWLGIVGILFCVNLLVVALVMRYEGMVVRLGQLARPATVAAALTLAILALMAYGRFWLEARGLVLS